MCPLEQPVVKLAIMQPYFLPYIGYFQLITAVDKFVIYDNIKFTKTGWINRNRILVNGRDAYITLPVKRDSDFLDVRDRFLAECWADESRTMLNRIAGAYRKAPNFKFVYPLIEECVLFDERNLFQFILHSLTVMNKYLQIETPVSVSSTILIDHGLKAKEKVKAICKAMNATEYVNPIGGVDLYQREDFRREGIELHFLKSGDIIYEQFGHAFVPRLSIVDVMMFNSLEKIQQYLNDSYEWA